MYTHYGNELLAEEAVGIALFVGMMLVTLFIVLAVSAVVYVFQSIGLYSIAKRRGIRNYGLAWVPLANMWILGSVADQYDYAASGKRKNSRFILLALEIAAAVFALGFLLCLFVAAVSSSLGSGLAGGLTSSTLSARLSFTVVPLLTFMWIITMAVSIVTIVFVYISLHKLYKSCSPDNATLFTVLSILFLIYPFFIFAVRNKDLGMPDRASAAAAPNLNAAEVSQPAGEFADDYNPYARETAEGNQQNDEE